MNQKQQQEAAIRVITDLYSRGDIASAIELEKTLAKSTGLPYKGQQGSVRTEQYLSRLITQDPDMLAVKDYVRRITPEDDCVLILGPSGTGKEIIANALHGSRYGQFVPINCTGLPDYLLESELFGHEKGSFTGAMEQKVGIFKSADNGTVFMDEIGDMPSALQAKLLRVIETGRVRPVGANKEIDINCRFVFATNKRLTSAVKDPTDSAEYVDFREDLYWRISTFEVRLTALKDRPLDVPLIAASIDPKFPIDKELKSWEDTRLLSGNCRELKRIIRRWQINQ